MVRNILEGMTNSEVTLNVLVSVFHSVRSGNPLLVCLGSLTYLSNIPAITLPPIQLTKP